MDALRTEAVEKGWRAESGTHGTFSLAHAADFRFSWVGQARDHAHHSNLWQLPVKELKACVSDHQNLDLADLAINVRIVVAIHSARLSSHRISLVIEATSHQRLRIAS